MKPTYDELVQRLEALVGDDESLVVVVPFTGGTYQCLHCKRCQHGVGRNIEHAPDCPVVLGREAVRKAKEEG